MIEREFVRISGSEGSGKTTFIEHLLRSNRSRLLMVARGVHNTKLKRFDETPWANVEIGRYQDAGASGAGCFRFPGTAQCHDDFFCSEFMADYSQGVIIEGESPLRSTLQLEVYVTSPVDEGRTLLRRAASNNRAKTRTLLARSEGLKYLFPRDLLSSRNPAWSLEAGFAGIELAQVVVINVRSDAERTRGELMVKELKRLRQDPEVFNDIVGWRGSRVSAMAIVADMSNDKDKGLKRLLTRVKRAFRAPKH